LAHDQLDVAGLNAVQTIGVQQPDRIVLVGERQIANVAGMLTEQGRLADPGIAPDPEELLQRCVGIGIGQLEQSPEIRVTADERIVFRIRASVVDHAGKINFQPPAQAGRGPLQSHRAGGHAALRPGAIRKLQAVGEIRVHRLAAFVVSPPQRFIQRQRSEGLGPGVHESVRRLAQDLLRKRQPWTR
jgi:hypothetical protein